MVTIRAAVEVGVVYVDGDIFTAKDALKERPELGLASDGDDVSSLTIRH